MTKMMTQAQLQATIAKEMPEAELQDNVISLIRHLGGTTFHIRDSRGQNVVGLPDLFCLLPPSHFWIEFKRQGKEPEVVQQAVIDLMRRCGITVFILHPSDWLDGTIERILKG